MTDNADENVGSYTEDPGLDPRSQNEATVAGNNGAAEVNPTTIDELQSEVQRARSDAAASQDRYLRALADMDNYKKRIERTYADLTRTSKKELLKKLLGVMDNLERALQYAGGEESNGVLEGVRLTQYQLEGLLAAEGVRPIDAAGKPFDPRLEEAVHSVHRPELPDHQVVEVARKGYTYKSHNDEEEVLRPAQVVVNVYESAQGEA